MSPVVAEVDVHRVVLCVFWLVFLVDIGGSVAAISFAHVFLLVHLFITADGLKPEAEDPR